MLPVRPCEDGGRTSSRPDGRGRDGGADDVEEGGTRDGLTAETGGASGAALITNARVAPRGAVANSPPRAVKVNLTPPRRNSDVGSSAVSACMRRPATYVPLVDPTSVTYQVPSRRCSLAWESDTLSSGTTTSLCSPRPM